MKIVVTGGLGHIGSKLIRELPKQVPNCQITVIDDLSTQRYPSLFNLETKASYKLIPSKVQETDLKTVFKEVDHVIHLAATTDAAGTADTPELVHDNNFNSTKLIAEACLETDTAMIFPSSTSVYGSQSNRVDETCTELQPQSPYAHSKINEEKLLQEMTKKGLKVAILRLGTIFGVSPGIRFHTAVNKFCWQAAFGLPVTVWETAMDQKRPYLDLDDCCRAISWVVSNDLANGEIFNVLSQNLTVRNVIDEISKHVKLNVELVQHKIMNQLSYEVDCSKFEQTGFSFTGNIATGVAETLNLFKPFIESKA